MSFHPPAGNILQYQHPEEQHLPLTHLTQHPPDHPQPPPRPHLAPPTFDDDDDEDYGDLDADGEPDADGESDYPAGIPYDSNATPDRTTDASSTSRSPLKIVLKRNRSQQAEYIPNNTTSSTLAHALGYPLQAPLDSQDSFNMPSTRRSGRGQPSATPEAENSQELGRGQRRRTQRISLAEQDLEDTGDEDPIGESILNDQDDGGHINKRGKVEPPDGADEDAEGEEDDGSPAVRFTRSGRRSQHVSYAEPDDDDDDDDVKPRRRTASRTSKSLADFVAPDDEDDEDQGEAEYGAPRKAGGRVLRSRTDRLTELAAKRGSSSRRTTGDTAKRRPASRRAGGRAGSRGRVGSEDYEEAAETPEDDEISGGDEEIEAASEEEHEDSQARQYSFRARKKVNYSLVPPPASPPRDGFGRLRRSGAGRGGSATNAFEIDGLGGKGASTSAPGLPGLPSALPGRGRKGKEGWDALPLSMTGKDYARAFGDPVDSSDDDIPGPKKAGAAGGASLLGGTAAGGLLGAGPAAAGAGGTLDLGGSGATDGLGRIKKSGDALADVDPLGVNMQIDFSAVGGLDGHIQQLKEMVTLPLLYPEVFQRFHVTPPRGVLFHGPPGTGKTLLARALAASCSSEGQSISFFMRKGADCLSKWVGEAERQLRLLFEEARNAQPSIIFFDEIDGLAPVRSSKQDQIHASIVSTLLALMDGMDGRGQVIVIGATNRPDSVDSALRRPGRFDREFYFPLPAKEARRKILDIQTKGWEPPLKDEFKDRLAEVTKGYGGADLRALCTEAALNAIQRRYPQIYQTTDRLKLQPETINVEAKDFMISVQKIVPSSARSSSSVAAPLPDHFKPLLGQTLEEAIEALNKVLPPVSKRNPLEEALWETDEVGPPLSAPGAAGAIASNDNGFAREMLLQSFESLRVFRPRFVVHGKSGMGQSFLAAAVLHALEGYHVQSLDIAALMGDSGRTPEAACVQLFVEARRHKPSVLFIPGLIHWATSVSESVRSTVKALLDNLAPSDPVLLLAVAEGPLDLLPRDVRAWFGYLRDNKVEIQSPGLSQRQAFFNDVLGHVRRPPNEFPDAMPRRKRVLDELPKAPPKPPRVPTQAELQAQVENDARLLEHLKYRLGPVLAELRKKFKKFTRDVWDEYNLQDLTHRFDWRREKGKIIVTIRYDLGPGASGHDASAGLNGVPNGDVSGDALGGSAVVTQVQPPSDEVAPPAVNGDVTMDSAAGINGSAHETAPHAAGVNGDVSMELHPQHLQDQQQQQPEVEQPAQQQHQQSESEQLTQDGQYLLRDLPIFTMNLEKMQKKLYYNGYLSCSTFMDDLGKIVANAEEAQEVDADRVFRAHQMRNLAIVLMDQYVDSNFKHECERMAQRQAVRDREAVEAAEKSKAAAAQAAVPPPRPAGMRHSARAEGKAPEYDHPVDVLAIERNNKRARRSSSNVPEQQGGEGIEGDAARKRARTSKSPGSGIETPAPATPTMMQPSGSDQAQLQLDPTAASAASAPGDPMLQSVPESMGAVGLPPREAQPNGLSLPSETKEASDELAVLASAAASDAAPAPAALPPFELDERKLDSLAAHLLTRTATFTIEQLEQLRAAWFDKVWRHRSFWDRNPLLEELYRVTEDFALAVAEEDAADQDL